MKPAPFDYALASSIDDALKYLAEGDGEAIILAGGQTLMPMLSMRLARPELVVDINEVDELSGIEIFGSEVRVLACTRQVSALNSPIVSEHLPLLAKAISHVGHFQTRNRGTVGGSLAHADPAAEIPLAALALNAEVEIRRVSGSRRLGMADYFLGPMMTAREPDELLVSLNFPISRNADRCGTGFHEVSERHGDFAVVAVAAYVELEPDGACRKVAVAIGGVDAYPVRIDRLEAALAGRVIDRSMLSGAVALIDDAIEPGSDQHASADYRRRVARSLAARAIGDAVVDAGGQW